MDLTDTQIKILVSLAKYKFLTTSQLKELVGVKRRATMYDNLNTIKGDRKLIQEVKFGFDPGKGRMESFWHLKEKGKRQIVNNYLLDSDEILMPSGKVRKFKDYYHRKYTLDCHVQCEREMITNFFYRYFDSGVSIDMVFPGGKIIPDGAFMVTNNGESSLYALEVYNDEEATRPLKQLNKHLQCLENSSLGKALELKKGHRVCCVFQNFSVMQKVMQNFEPGQEGRFFLFKTQGEVLKSFRKNWVDMFGNGVNLV